jgi:hypothetical protein
MAVSPSDGAVVLRMTGVSTDPSAEFQAATRESLSVDVTEKPLISLVWAGFYVMMAGAFLALVKRARETRRAVVAESAEPAPPERAPLTSPGPAVPAPSGV